MAARAPQRGRRDAFAEVGTEDAKGGEAIQYEAVKVKYRTFVKTTEFKPQGGKLL